MSKHVSIFIFCTCQLFPKIFPIQFKLLALLPHRFFVDFKFGDFKSSFQLGIVISTKRVVGLSATLHGLKMTLGHGIHKVDIYGDSNLILLFLTRYYLLVNQD